MELSRRDFLTAAAVLGALPLMSMAPSPVDPNNLDRNRWYEIWINTGPDAYRHIGRLSGVTRYPAPPGTILVPSHKRH